MQEFQKGLPEGFRTQISKSVITMNKGGKKDGKKEIIQTYNTQLIFARVIYLLSIDQIKIDNLFSYELAPFPTSLF